MNDLYKNYYKFDYTFDSSRGIVWGVIVRFLSKFVPKDSVVVDLGAGYCDFINNITAGKKYAVDISPELSKYAFPDVEKINSSAWDLNEITDNSVDVVHASNLFEHFSDEELLKVINEIRRILKTGGKLILMQPNFKYAYKSYFDDHTHKKIFTHVSLEAFLLSYNFSTILNMPKFLPFSLRSNPGRLPFLSWIVWAYIRSPYKPFAGQMLIVSQKND